MFFHLLTLGRVPYAEGLSLSMRSVVDARKAGAIGGHAAPPGAPARPHSRPQQHRRANILATDELLARKRRVSLHEINRGGDITYHGPGQLDRLSHLRSSRRPSGSWTWQARPAISVRLTSFACMEEALILTCKRVSRVPAQRPSARAHRCVDLRPAAASPKRSSRPSASTSPRPSLRTASRLNVTTDLRDLRAGSCLAASPTAASPALELESATATHYPRFTQVPHNSAATNFGRVFHRQVLARRLA